MTLGEERVAVYDRHGAVIGSATRARMRAEGLWHAATSVLVRSTDLGEVYVHRRTADKDVYPGMYDCWAGGVVGAGESPDTAARRELAEELGIHAEPRFLFRTRHELGSVRFHAFVYEIRWDGPIVHQPEEIAAGWWMPLAELRERTGDPDWPFVPDGRQFATEWFEFRGG
ncbi:NUDIX hydrolase [Actinopolyspora xinjiangensis]|uniref:NUDIX hydrolase n=1 Tax=Actinopolyspora xinjiangensis TaxID=405564 RepID=UPI001FCD4E96|nr:NUDIX domain-containing protein [Actinopolyspora xinjiangensis]